MTRSLADAHKKIAVLTEEPLDREHPTVLELNGGIGGAAGAGCSILLSDWTFSPADSDSFSEPAVCDEGNAEAFGRSNGTAGLTAFREFDETDGTPDPIADALFEAGKVKGTRLWIYERETGQPEDEPWAEGDELWYWAEVITDRPQRPGEAGGWIKRRIPLKVQKDGTDATVGA